MIICHNCKGNGEIAEGIYYQQSWEDGDGNPVVYHGPPLDGNEFKNYKIYPK